MRDIKGEVAIVTGGSKGLGRSIVHVLADEGCRVVAVARGREALAQVEGEERERGHEVIGVSADISREEDVDRVMETARRRFGDVDILVNNAGVARFAPIEEIPTPVFDEIVSTNMRGTFLLTRAVVPSMKKRRTGQIIIVSSAAGVRGQPEQTVYSATKFAQVGFAQALDGELREFGIRVGVFNPGSIDTPLWEDVALDESKKRRWIEWGKGAMPSDDAAEAIRLMVRQEPGTRILQLLMRPMAEPFE